MITIRMWTLALIVSLLALPSTAHTQAPTYRVTPDVVYGHKAGMALTFDVLHPPEPNGAAVLYMVSGGWVSRWSPPEETAERFGELLDRGFTVVAVRHGSSPRFKVPEAHADVDRAVRYVRLHAEELGIDRTRLGVFGGSAGGHLSLMLGLAPEGGTSGGSAEGSSAGGSGPSVTEGSDEVARTPGGVAAVVAYYPPVDLRPIAGPSDRFPALDFDPARAASISPIRFASPDDPPTLLIHGDADQLVPIRNSEIMHAALNEEGVTTDFITIPGGDHGFRRTADRARAESAMVDWFVEHLGDAPGN